jgi:hypothetical protein
LLSDALKARR